MKRMLAASVPALTQTGRPDFGSQVGPPVVWMTTMSMACLRGGPLPRACAGPQVRAARAARARSERCQGQERAAIQVQQGHERAPEGGRSGVAVKGEPFTGTATCL